MVQKTNEFAISKTVYPLSVSVSMVIVAILLSFVDLTFLNDVIGKVLDFGTLESMVVAFALGLVGIVIMAHLGIRAAHDVEGARGTVGHYILWVLLGFAFVLIRLFSASIMHLDGSSGDTTLVTVLGMNIREVDLVLAPLMFFLYLATGIMVKDGVKNLLLNPEYENKLVAWSEARGARKNEDTRRRMAAERRIAKLRDEAERKRQQREKEIEEERLKLRAAKEKASIEAAINGTYSHALAQYRAKEKEIKEKYQKISTNLDFIKSIDKQEKEFELKVKPSLLHIVQESIFSIQSSVALTIRKMAGEDIAKLRNEIDLYNNRRHE